MQLPDIIRYSLWSGVVTVAMGNRRAYALTTTWLPHLVTNSLSLLLPDMYRLVDALDQRDLPARPHVAARDTLQLVRGTLDAMVRDNPSYVVYVAPLAAGYLLSSPWLNIYKGELAEKRLAGFGLDALPHAATAFALTRLIGDTLTTAAELSHVDGAAQEWIEWCARHQKFCSAVVLGLVTLMWERGEYLIYRHELDQRGSAENINMQWSASDTVTDCIANAAGWLLAIGLSHQAFPSLGRRFRFGRRFILR